MSEPTPDEARKARNVAENRVSWSDSDYYDLAEEAMEMQWGHIAPILRGHDLENVLELAPGHGRNTERLKEICGELHLVDLNESCIEHCRRRFADHTGDCRISYYVNDGSSLSMLADGSITFVYSFDSMVHFDRLVVREYVREFARVMRPGAHGLVHYSNYGAKCADPDSTWLENPHARSTMSRELFESYCADAGLEIVGHRLVDWEEVEELDCLTLFRKPELGGERP